MTQEKIQEKTLAEQKAEILFEEFENFSSAYLPTNIAHNRRHRGVGGSKKYTKELLQQYLESPEVYSSNLIDFSEYLYRVSPTYNKIIDFYATLPTYAYVVDAPKRLDTKILKKTEEEYFTVLELLEKMSLRHELQKIMKITYKQDIFYGYEIETDDSFYVKSMPREYCQITSIEDGVFNYSFNFSYFIGQEHLLGSFPKEFTTIYNNILKERTISQNVKSNKVISGTEIYEDYMWRELSPQKAFALKLNEDIPYPLPPFVTSMESALEEEMYNEMKRDKNALENFIALVQKIPLNDDDQSLDVFRLDLTLARRFHQDVLASVPEGVGVITSPMSIEAVKLEKSKQDDDLAMIAKDNTLSNAGLPPNIFSTTNKTSGGIKYAIQYLEQVSFAPLRQVERWINRKLKRLNGRNKFQIRMLDVTNYSRDEVFDRNLKASQFGISTKQETAAALGQSPLDFENKITIEELMLNLSERMKPLASSHTQKADSKEAGREKMNDQDITESTNTWRENQ